MLDHSRARTVAVTLHREGDQCRLIIADDGTGATSAKRESHKRGGLAGIRERVNQLGGIVTLASPGDGFRIIAELPIAHLELERGRDE
jgi:signal transduction histidine kinase